jgi:hypothetical protein
VGLFFYLFAPAFRQLTVNMGGRKEVGIGQPHLSPGRLDQKKKGTENQKQWNRS